MPRHHSLKKKPPATHGRTRAPNCAEGHRGPSISPDVGQGLDPSQAARPPPPHPGIVPPRTVPAANVAWLLPVMSRSNKPPLS